MLLFIRLAVEEGRTLQKIHSLSYSFILQAQAQLPESLPAFSIATEKKGKKGVGGKIGIITHVRTYMRT
ncbi:MAG: hypothetical protein EP150_14625 [Prevotella copri]|nr:hypothetical protein [Segatella copri]MUU14331.1 hypothetical protein [Segatella copri]